MFWHAPLNIPDLGFRPGLTNQLYFFLNAVREGFSRGYRSFAVGDFLLCIHSGKLSLASEIFDFHSLAESMSGALGAPVTFRDWGKVPFKLRSAYSRPALFPPADPAGQDLFRRLVGALRFAPSLLAAARRLKAPPPGALILHLRLEEDAIEAWCGMSGLSPSQYRQELEEKYLQALSLFPPETPIYCLCGDSALAARFAARAGRAFFQVSEEEKRIACGFLEPTSSPRKTRSARERKQGTQGREVNAILDYLLIPASADFVGSLGSTFTELIALGAERKKKVLVNMRNAVSPLVIFDDAYTFDVSWAGTSAWK